MPLHHVSRVALVVLSLAFVACGDSGPTEPEVRPPAAALALSGSGQSGEVGGALPAPLVVQVKDAKGRAVSGVSVAWTVAQGGGSVSGATTTDAQGQAQASWTLGTTAGAQSVQAGVSGLQPVVFSATATSDRAASVQITPDSVVLQTWGDTARLSAVVKDQFGNVIPGAAVTWSSSDTTLASVNATGVVVSYPAGRAGTSMITATSQGVRASSKAIVKLQVNARCMPPTSFPVRRAVGGLPSFSVQDSLDTPGLAYSRHDAVTFDHDRDGDEDVVVLSYEMPPNEPYGGALLVWSNNGAGRFSDVGLQALGGTPIVVDNSSNHTVVADFNGDGLLDMFVALGGYDAGSFPGAKNLLVLGGAGGTFREVGASNLSPNTKAFTHSAAGADIDCDGDVDLYEGNIERGSPHLLINTGGAVFHSENSRLPSEIAQLNKQYLSAEFCDVDRDGDREPLPRRVAATGRNRSTSDQRRLRPVSRRPSGNAARRLLPQREHHDQREMHRL